MNLGKYTSIGLLLAGEALIIFCFLHFGRNADPQIRALNIIISSFILCLNFIDILFPWVNWKDKSQKSIGSLGLRWVVMSLYVLFAVGIMIVFNIFIPIGFGNQLLLHAGLIFFFLVGLFLTFTSSANVKSVFEHEEKARSGIAEMKKITNDVRLKLDQMNNLPGGLFKQITDIQDDLRFISPSDNAIAKSLENEFIMKMKSVYDSLYNLPLDEERINRLIHDCNRIYRDRKQIFSN
ncbi:MAG TPA: hypothetical protein PLW31_14965 [Bacteroidales bacterium]|nr:hypothetical protein [Bacteroidales bacterium]